MRRTVIIIPAFNCGATIGGLIRRLRYYAPLCEILVVNDGSADATAAEAERLSVKVITHPRRRGKGAALQTGMDWAFINGFGFAITMDADGQHDPAEIQRFLFSGADLAVGQRAFKRGLMPLPRIFSNWLSSLLVSLVAGRKIRDSQCGYRKVSLKAVEGFKPSTTGYQYETELLLYVSRVKKGTIANIPIRTIYQGEKSHIRHIPDTWEFCSVIWRYFWTSK